MNAAASEPVSTAEPSNAFYDYTYTLASDIRLRCDGRTALLIVDMQYHDASASGGFNVAIERARPGSLNYYNERVETTVVPTIVRLLDFFRRRELPVVFLTLGSDHLDYRDFPTRSRSMILDLERESGVEGIMWSGSPGFQIRHELAPRAHEPVVVKRSAGAFSSSEIDSVLKELGIETLVVVGVTTSCCVESTAREAVDRGYGCVLVDDGTAEYDAQAHAGTLRTFHANFGRAVKGANDVMTAMKEGSDL